MANKKWTFSNFDDLEEEWNEGRFDCDDIADIDDPLVLDWCERINDWAPKVALCFNRYTSAVTLDRISQAELPELRRLVCYHQNASLETLERLLEDGDRETRETAEEYLQKKQSPYWNRRKTKKARA
jgi:hypothetical protein